jgi:hypothetical protein
VFSTRITGILTGRVTPFGNPRITKCMLLPGAFRSLPRPSSPDSSKTSAVNPYSLDHIIFYPFLYFSLFFLLYSSYVKDQLYIVGLARIELATSRLSGVRSNQLSYRPIFSMYIKKEEKEEEDRVRIFVSLRKEVIQPHLPVRLPCYDFTPLTGHTFGAVPHCWLDKRLRVHPTRVV